MNISLSAQQDQAIKDVKTWYNDLSGSQVFYLAGYAGTGKSTLAKLIRGDVKGRVLYAAFTGKAALVMQRKGCFGASTIHSLIYRVEEGDGWQPSFVLNPLSEVKGAALVIVDECSMVDEQLGSDLLSFGTKVLVLGDPGQLPPVKGDGFFTARQPDFMLTEVHRQALDNPIIRMSMDIRAGKRLKVGQYGSSRVIRRAECTPDAILKADQVLCGLNKTRRSFNARIRQLKDMNDEGPQNGDKLICLRNNREKKLINGGIWEVKSIEDNDKETITMLAESEDHIEAEPTSITVRKEFFHGQEDSLTWNDRKGTDEFTYGYAITCHKSQGSQWDNVVIFDESSAFRELAKNHLYTAVTRAASELTLVI